MEIAQLQVDAQITEMSQSLWKSKNTNELLAVYRQMLVDLQVLGLEFMVLSQHQSKVETQTVFSTTTSLAIEDSMKQQFLDRVVRAFTLPQQLDLMELHHLGQRYHGLITCERKHLIVYAPPVESSIFRYLATQFFYVYKHLFDWEQTKAQLLVDELTGLYNCRFLDIFFENEIKRCSRFQNPFTIVFIDLDNFKRINDTYGHLVGSLTLKQVSLVLKRAVREIDYIIRYGGDEFIIVLLQADLRTGQKIAERIRSDIEIHSFGTLTQPIHLTASFGLASFPSNGSEKTSLISLADAAMYSSKKSGKNKVSVVLDH